MTRGRLIAIVVMALIAGAVALKFGPMSQQRSLPAYAAPEFIDRHFREQLEALRRYSVSGKLPDDSEGEEMFRSDAIRSATIFTRYGDKSRTGIAVKPSPFPDAGSLPLPDLNKEGTFVTPANDGCIHYEQRFRVEGALRGFELVLEASALRRLQ